MPDGQVLEFTNVTKRFNEVTAVSDFSARVEPGAVTAFLGPNGAGKTTTLRILLGQVRATSGTATVGGTAFAELRQPLRTVGSVLEDTVYRPRRTANRQLTIAAKANGIPLSRVDEVLAMVGLEGEGDSRIGGFSLGMRQRLSVANAMLGDPGALVFDEPANGLDPEGIRWMRLLMRRLADEGRTVLVSSHVLSEVEQFADNVLVLSKGRLVLASGIETLADPKGGSVVVDAADRAALTTALSAAGFDIEVLRSGLTVRGADAGTVGSVAAAAGIALSTLVQRGPTLEDVFIDLVRGGKLSPRADAAASELVAPVAAGAVAGEAGAAGAGTIAPAADGAVVPSASESDPEPGAAASDDAAEEETVAESVNDESGEEASGQEAVEQSTVEVSLVETLAAEESVAEQDGSSDEQNALRENEDADSSDSPVSHETPASEDTASSRSFDEILFGTSTATAPESTADAATESETEAQVEVDHAGVEFFSELGETDAAAESAPDDADRDADDSERADEEPDQQPEATEQSEEGDDDPRSAAISSMLAAAARAYYDDEPKDYPQDAPSSDADGAQWTIASTGVIDTVPLADESAPESEADADHHDAHEGEHHEHGENHEHHEHEEHHDNHEHGEHHHG